MNPDNLQQRIIKSSVTWNNEGMMLLNYLASRFTYRNLAEWQERIDNGEITVNGNFSLPEYRLKLHDIIEYRPRDIVEPDADLNYRIIYEDEQLLVVEKPGNLCVHPAGPFFKHTLWHLLCTKYGNIHLLSRLDRETSGILLAAKTAQIAAKMQSKKYPPIRKSYLAAVHGSFTEKFNTPGWLISNPQNLIRKKRIFTTERPDDAQKIESAHTVLEPVTTANGFSLVKAYPITGRMHQIRATLCSLGFPLCGDKLYGLDETMYLRQSHDELTDDDWKKLLISRQALHSAEVDFQHPCSGEQLHFESTLPQELANLFAEKH